MNTNACSSFKDLIAPSLSGLLICLSFLSISSHENDQIEGQKISPLTLDANFTHFAPTNDPSPLPYVHHPGAINLKDLILNESNQSSSVTCQSGVRGWSCFVLQVFVASVLNFTRKDGIVGIVEYSGDVATRHAQCVLKRYAIMLFYDVFCPYSL